MNFTRRIVVVGAGSSGCVLANRLSADPETEVVLVEAGRDYYPGPTPADLRRGGQNSFTAHDWGYVHKPNAVQPSFPLPRGRVVGGSSAVNTCIALRGQPSDYDEWSARGLTDWSWSKCLPAFRALEQDLDFDDAWHGTEGPLPVRRHPEAEWTPWQTAFVEACHKLGHSRCEDVNRPGSVGVGAHALNKVASRRISAADAWLTTDVRRRDNLRIRSETHVHRVEFDGARATGVLCESSEGMQVLHADEVILCAGAVNTPGILVRSGVGDADNIRALGVDLIAENPHVGRQLLDHPGTAMFLMPRLNAGTSRSHDLMQTVCRFASGANPMTNDLIMQPGSSVPTPWGVFPFVSVMFQLGKPKGTGTIRFDSADPHAKPIIESRVFEHPDDREAALDAFEQMIEIATSGPMSKLARPMWPPKPVLTSRSLLRRFLPRVSDSGYHPSGTAPMGTDVTRGACDQRGNVFGTEQLRVVDASLFPTIPTANIHLSVLMMAEQISESIMNSPGSMA